MELLESLSDISHYEFWTKTTPEYEKLARHFGLRYKVRRSPLSLLSGRNFIRSFFARLYMRKALNGARCVIYQGGPRWTRTSIGPKFERKLVHQERFVQECQKRNTPVLHIGTSIGPLDSSELSELHWERVRGILSKSTAVLTRDSFSLASTEVLDVGSVVRGQCHDTALAIRAPGQPPAAACSPEAIGLSIREFQPSYGISREQQKLVLKEVADTVDTIAAKESRSFLALPMTHVDTPKVRSDQTLMSILSQKATATFDWHASNRDPVSVLNGLGCCDMVISMRLHVAILAALAGIPTILIGYVEKCEDFMASLGLSKYLIDINAITGGEIMQKYHELKQEKEAVKAQLRKRVKELQVEQKERVSAVMQSLLPSES